MDFRCDLYNTLIDFCMLKNNVNIYPTENESKWFIPLRFVSTLKYKNYKWGTSVLEDVCLKKLVDIVADCNSS